MNKPKLSLGDIGLRVKPETTNAEILQKENDRMRGLCKEASEVIAELNTQNQKLRSENDQIKKLNIKITDEWGQIIAQRDAAYKEVMELRNAKVPKETRKLIATPALRFVMKPFTVRESKFGAVSEGIRHERILQQWYSETGGSEDIHGEWRNVEAVNAI